MKKSIDEIDVRGKRVLVRLDLNVPLDDTGRIIDDRRIRTALPTIQNLIQKGGRLILISHLGRPDGTPQDRRRFSLTPVAQRLQELIARNVIFLQECIGESVAKTVARLGGGDVCLLENLRFHEAETIKDKKAAENGELRACKDSFARQLADLADVYVNDAFGTCHRDNASMLTVPQQMRGKPRVVGYLVQKELRFLGESLANPRRPFLCLLGGAKVSDKLGVIRSLLSRCDTVLIGGAMAYTFLAAAGRTVGKSLVEPDLFDAANEIRSQAGRKLGLPIDSVVAPEIKPGKETAVCEGDISENKMGLDIGPKTIAAYRHEVLSAKTIFWNGPMGVFEIPPFDAGTIAMARAVAEATDRGAVSIVGGGDSGAAIDRAGLADRITHVSTGGGASLEYLEGRRFAAIDILDDA